ncbi:ribosome-associated heat shock protein Hsp15 [Orbaceae bacterium ESL0727]|nr:ribosome-associated heat shock protein Hsp15 [Orbaceae bacterium ESL0727]
MEPVRLDKWLWVARFYKTRSLAREMVDGGKVHYNGQRTKPSKIVEIGAMLQLRQGCERKEIRILAIGDKRGSADQASKLYQETSESLLKREQIAQARKFNALTMPHPDRRPDKKERRHLIKFKHSQDV